MALCLSKVIFGVSSITFLFLKWNQNCNCLFWVLLVLHGACLGEREYVHSKSFCHVSILNQSKIDSKAEHIRCNCVVDMHVLQNMGICFSLKKSMSGNASLKLA